MTTTSIQQTYNPMDYNFTWTANWYKWDRKAGTKAALQARNQAAKELKARGYTVRVWSMHDQLITVGGIGSGHPQIEAVVTAYGLNAW